MRHTKGNILIYLLLFVLVVQVYIMFFNDPVKLSKSGLIENRILLQGKDPGVPQPIPGKEPEEAGQVQTVQEIGTHARPAVRASHGEGQAMPKQLKSSRRINPYFPTMPKDFRKALITVDSSEDYYKALIYGILILEETDELALTPEQAFRLKKVLEMKSKVQGAVPEAQNDLLKNLSISQLRYMFLRMCIERGGGNPLPPETLGKYSREVYYILKERMKN